MKKRVIHVVTGGGSGATQVALDLACAQNAGEVFEPLVLLRRKKGALPPAMQAQIERGGLGTLWLEDVWPKTKTVAQIVQICRDFAPHAFLAHGFPEHLWSREAALQAGVPVVVHVEHNFERYLPWRGRRARQLAHKTTLTVCVSSALAQRVRERGFAAPRVEVIHNGVDTTRFGEDAPPLAQRKDDIVMAARFARQKDHATLVRAAARLVAQGWTGRLLLAGGGKKSHRRKCEQLVQTLGVGGRVEFLGLVNDMPALLRSCRVAALSTRYEGFGLSLVEGMAAGCAVVASQVPGVTDVMSDGQNGWLFPLGDDAGAAKVLIEALRGDDAAQRRAAYGREQALSYFTRERMVADYERLLLEL